MKRLIISSVTTVFLFFGTLEKAHAQFIELGFKGGLNVSSHLQNFTYSEADINLEFEPKLTTGYLGGVIIRNNLSRNFRLQTEPTLSLLGARYQEAFTFRGSEFQTQSRTKLVYVQVPLLFQLSTSGRDKTVYGDPYAKTTYHISGGVYGGYLVDARFSGINTGNPIGIPFESEFSNNIASQYSEYDGGAIFGLGFEHGYDKKIGFETRALLSVYDSDPQIHETQNLAVTFSVYLML